MRRQLRKKPLLLFMPLTVVFSRVRFLEGARIKNTNKGMWRAHGNENPIGFATCVVSISHRHLEAKSERSCCQNIPLFKKEKKKGKNEK